MMTQRLPEQFFRLSYIFNLIIGFSLLFHQNKRIRKILQPSLCEFYYLLVFLFFITIIYISFCHEVGIWVSLCTVFKQFGSFLFFTRDVIIPDKLTDYIFTYRLFVTFFQKFYYSLPVIRHAIQYRSISV